MIRAWMVAAAVSLTALAVFAAVVIRWQETRWAAFTNGRDGR